MKDDIDFVQSSLYGDDLVAFTKQAKGYGFFDELPFMALPEAIFSLIPTPK
jgi:hypothetical protein